MIPDPRPTHPLVLLPGLLCDAAVWRDTIAALGGRARCWVADLTRDDTMTTMARRVLAECPFERFALAGFSMGGYVAMELWRQAPGRIGRLALLATSARTDTPERVRERERFIALAEGDGFQPITRTMLAFLVHPDRRADAALAGEILAMAGRVGAPAYVRQQRAMLCRPDSRATLPTVNCPALVLCGRQDERAPPEVHEEMAAAIPGARLAVLEDCGHMLPMERPAAVAGALAGWLAN